MPRCSGRHSCSHASKLQHATVRVTRVSVVRSVRAPIWCQGPSAATRQHKTPQRQHANTLSAKPAHVLESSLYSSMR